MNLRSFVNMLPDVKGFFNLVPVLNQQHHFTYPLVAPAAQYIPPTSSFFYLLYEISVDLTKQVKLLIIQHKQSS